MEGETRSEKRHVRRFPIKAFAVVQAVSPGGGKVFDLSTQDISSGGAFFPMEVPLPTGEKVKISIYVAISPLERRKHFHGMTKITTEGRVVRSTAQGMAVAFGKRYTISPAFI